MAVSENSFITGSQDRTFRGWSVHEEGFETDFNMLSEDIIKCTSINETKTLIALGLRNGNVEVYKSDEEESWKFHCRIQCHDSEVLCLSWNGTVLATGGRDRFVHLIQVHPDSTHSAIEHSPLQMHTSNVNAVHWMKGIQINIQYFIVYIIHI